MSTRPLLLVIVALLVCRPVTASGVAPSWPHVTVERRDGTRLSDVTLAWALDGFLLELTAAEGAVTTLAPSQVRAVLAADGRDVTDEVGDACPATDVDFRLLGHRARRPFAFAVMAGAGPGLGLANVEGGEEPHLTGQAGLRLAAGERAHLHLGLRRQRQTEAALDGITTVDAVATDLFIAAGARLKHPRENDNYSYLEAGVLLAHFSRRFGGADGTALQPAGAATGFLAQGGVVLPLGAHLGVDLGGSLQLRPSMVTQGDAHLQVAVNVALTWRDAGDER